MQAVRSLLIILFGLAIGIGASIAVCIYGWGLDPKSWWWIIGGHLLGQSVAHAVVALGKGKDE
jgi:hypothetical protein